MTRPVLRPAAPAHAPALAALHAAAFAPADRWPGHAFATQLGLPGCFGVVGRHGFILVRVAADEAEILTLAVHPDARRRGLGTALLRAAMARAAAEGARHMHLEVAEGNDAARALYAAAGYRATGRRPRYYPDGGDALVLSCALRA